MLNKSIGANFRAMFNNLSILIQSTSFTKKTIHLTIFDYNAQLLCQASMLDDFFIKNDTL